MNTIKNKLMDYGIWILLTLSILLLIIALILVYQTYDLLAEYNSFNVSQKEIIPVIGTNVTKREEIELVVRRGDSYKKIENF